MNLKRSLTLCSITVAAIATLATPAFAQETATTTTTTTTEVPVRRAGRTSGDIGSGGLGIGAAIFLSGLAGPNVVYDFGTFHLEGLLAFDRRPVNNGPNAPTASIFQFGIGGWYHLHLGENSDFSAGGVFALRDESAGGNSAVGFEIEPGVMIRAFLTPNVALHGRVGIVLAFGDNTGPLQKQLSLDGEPEAGLGVTYFFR